MKTAILQENSEIKSAILQEFALKKSAILHIVYNRDKNQHVGNEILYL